MHCNVAIEFCTITQIILATAGYDHTIKFWAADTGVCTRTLQHPDSQVGEVHPILPSNAMLQVNSLEVAPDGSMLAAGGYQHIRFGSIKLSPRKEMEEDSADIPMKVVYSHECMEYTYTRCFQDVRPHLWKPNSGCQL